MTRAGLLRPVRRAGAGRDRVLTMGVDYAPFYCEENVLRLAAARDRSTDWVVLLSNATRRIALAGQRRGRDGDGIVVWDYHVILVDRRGEGDASSTKVIDQDSLLDQPVPVCRYVATTFPWPRSRPRTTSM